MMHTMRLKGEEHGLASSLILKAYTSFTFVLQSSKSCGHERDSLVYICFDFRRVLKEKKEEIIVDIISLDCNAVL